MYFIKMYLSLEYIVCHVTMLYKKNVILLCIEILNEKLELKTNQKWSFALKTNSNRITKIIILHSQK